MAKYKVVVHMDDVMYLLDAPSATEAACEARRLVESNPTAVLNEAVVGIDAEPDEDEEN